MKVLVTGASGFIGAHIVRHLLERGDRVRAVYRRDKVPESLEQLERRFGTALELRRFDLSFPDSRPDFKAPSLLAWRREARNAVPASGWNYWTGDKDIELAKTLMQDCGAVIHAAALAGDWGSFETFFAVNTHPTHVLTRAALAMGIERFVFISSIAVHGFGPHRFSAEDGPYYRAVSNYQVSKRLSESLVAQAASEGLSALIVRPGNVYGPDDTTTFFPMFDAMVKGLMGTIDRGRRLTCPVFVDDLCFGVLAALDFPRKLPSDEITFNISDGEGYTWRELLDVAAEALDIKAPTLDLPSVVGRPVAALLEALFLLTGRKKGPPLTRYRIDQVGNDYSFSTARAEALLAYRPKTGLPEGMALCAQSWRRNRFGTA